MQRPPPPGTYGGVGAFYPRPGASSYPGGLPRGPDALPALGEESSPNSIIVEPGWLQSASSFGGGADGGTSQPHSFVMPAGAAAPYGTTPSGLMEEESAPNSTINPGWRHSTTCCGHLNWNCVSWDSGGVSAPVVCGVIFVRMALHQPVQLESTALRCAHLPSYMCAGPHGDAVVSCVIYIVRVCL